MARLLLDHFTRPARRNFIEKREKRGPSPACETGRESSRLRRERPCRKLGESRLIYARPANCPALRNHRIETEKLRTRS